MNGAVLGEKYFVVSGKTAQTVISRRDGSSADCQANVALLRPARDAKVLFIPGIEPFGVLRLEEHATYSANARHECSIENFGERDFDICAVQLHRSVCLLHAGLAIDPDCLVNRINDPDDGHTKVEVFLNARIHTREPVLWRQNLNAQERR